MKAKKLKAVIKNVAFSALCAGTLYYLTPSSKSSFWLSFILLFAAFAFVEMSPVIFDKLANKRYKKWVYSSLLTFFAGLILACISPRVACIATPLIFLFTFFGGFTQISKWFTAGDENLAELLKPPAKCENCGEFPHTYSHGVRKTSEYTNTTTNPAYNYLPNNIYHRNR